MDENSFKNALASIISGEYTNTDIKVVKQWLNSLLKKESSLIRQMEKNKNEYSKKKEKNQIELQKLRKDIKDIKKIL